ncbi:hypothetical protein [Saccharopolyspora taberi]|uniref:Uncharacterized protein n=1 Tax=Saccharopolyspora taberi TaxID=60895 RepID=A0ABN3VJE1_9PSEU
MDRFWVQVVIALVAGALGAAAVLTFYVLKRQARDQAPEQPPTTPAEPPSAPDRWLPQLRRCEQAVRRAALAVDSVSSAQARQALRTLVVRMDAELPNVRALVELGRSLDADEVREEAVLRRVFQQLDDAATRFGMITDHVLETVVQLVADADLSQMHEQVMVLREQFPLLRPMSAVFGPATAPPRSLISA